MADLMDMGLFCQGRKFSNELKPKMQVFVVCRQTSFAMTDSDQICVALSRGRHMYQTVVPMSCS